MSSRNKTTRSLRNAGSRGARKEDLAHRELLHAIRELQFSTQIRSVPTKPDVQFMEGSKRPTIHTFRQSIEYPNVTATNSDSSALVGFRLSDLQDAASYAALYDAYRLISVRVKFIPLVTPFGPSTTVAGFPSLYTAIDYDGSGPLTVSQISQYDTMQVTTNQEMVERVLTPRLTATAESTTGPAAAIVANPRTWLDVGNANVPYYGLVWVTSATSVTGTYQLYRIAVDTVWQFRSVR